VLAALALLTKQTYAAALLAGTVWLWTVDRKKAALYAAIGITLPLGVVMVEQFASHAFLTNTVGANANPLNLQQVVALLTLFAQTLLLPTLIAAAFVICNPSNSLLALYWLASALSLLGVAKFGASYNYWIEFAASTAVVATIGLWANRSLVARGLAVVFVVSLVVLVPTSLTTALAGVGGDGALTGLQPATNAEFQRLIEQVRSAPGVVLAEPLDIVVLAGREITLEPVIFSILERNGQWDAEPLAHQICNGEVSLLVLGFPIAAVAGYAPYGEPWWPPTIMQALQTCMTPAGERAGRYLYVPTQH
jgi:hypothetical protein